MSDSPVVLLVGDGSKKPVNGLNCFRSRNLLFHHVSIKGRKTAGKPCKCWKSNYLGRICKMDRKSQHFSGKIICKWGYKFLRIIANLTFITDMLYFINNKLRKANKVTFLTIIIINDIRILIFKVSDNETNSKFGTTLFSNVWLSKKVILNNVQVQKRSHW